MFRMVFLKVLKVTCFAAVAGVAAMRVYYVREMLAALILFTILFTCLAVVFLLLFMLDRACQALLEFLELRAKEVLQRAHLWWPGMIPDELGNYAADRLVPTLTHEPLNPIPISLIILRHQRRTR